MLPTATPTRQAAAGTSLFHPKRERALQDQGDHKKLRGYGSDKGSPGSYITSPKDNHPVSNWFSCGNIASVLPWLPSSPCLRCLFPCTQISWDSFLYAHQGTHLHGAGKLQAMEPK